MDGGKPGKQVAQRVPWTSGRGGIRDYLLFLPARYEQQDRWPLLLFMHGAGERGTDVHRVKKHGVAKEVERNADFPFVAVSPQCLPGSYWDASELVRLVDLAVEHLKIDLDRIYVTGLSMGGYATWELATGYTERFAAAVPVCGGGDPAQVCAARALPIWTFHGDADDIVPVQHTLRTVKALEACGGNVRHTIYPGVGHDSWTQTYANPEIYAWLLQHRLSDRR